MKRFVHFSCRPGSGGFELTYRQDGCWIRHDHIASPRCLFPDIESIEVFSGRCRPAELDRKLEPRRSLRSYGSAAAAAWLSDGRKHSLA